MKKIFSLSISLLATIILVNCKGNEPEEPIEESFDKQEMLQDLADHVILPSVSAFELETSHFKTASQNFTADPSNTTLSELHTAFEDLLYQWKLIEVFDIGDVKATYIYRRIETDESNEAFINEILTSDDEINNALIESKGSSVKGIRTIEQFIYHPTHTSDSVLISFTTDSLAERRKEYLLALSENLNLKAQELNVIWTGSNNYYQSFIENDGSSVSSSLSMLYNSNVALLEKVIHTRMGEPMGKSTTEGPAPEKVEYYNSKQSLTSINTSLKALNAIYISSLQISAEENTGLDDYVTFITNENTFATLNEDVLMAYEDALQVQSAIAYSLQDAVNQQPAELDTYYESLKSLLVYYKADLASALGITITFSDNDGD